MKTDKPKTADAPTKAGGITIHPTAMVFPTLDAKDMKELREDIKTNGVRVPLLFNKAETVLIDGRNRWYVAHDLGIPKAKLPIEHYKGKDEDIPSVIISRNLFRRHLNDKQRAALVTKLLAPAMEKEAKDRQSGAAFKGDGKVAKGGNGRTVEKIAKAAKVGRHTAELAAKVRKAGGDKALDDIISGKADLTEKAAKVPVQRRKPAKPTDKFEDRIWKDWNKWISKYGPTERRQVKLLIIEWIGDTKAEKGAKPF